LNVPLAAAAPGTAPVLAALTHPRGRIWSIGGGKGGIGKSLLAASLGHELCRLGKRVVLVDADLGGANLHTCLGVAPPDLTLGDFICRRVERIEDVVVPTAYPRLGLVSGASDFLAAANIKHLQKVRVLNRIRSLNVDIVLLDLGAGTSFNIIDFFLASDLGLLTVIPEPTSIENGYRFIKSALYRKLRAAAQHELLREIVDAALDPKSPRGIRTPLELLAAVQRECPDSLDLVKREMAAFRPRFVVNQVRGGQDAAVGHQLVTACARHLGIRAEYAGFVHYDDAVWQGVRQRRLFAAASPTCRAAGEVAQLARTLLQAEPLALAW
jgi:flagellar biosynthesis protein FlhG